MDRLGPPCAAGVFGALLHVEDREFKQAARTSNGYDDDDLALDEPLEEKTYMLGRKMLTQELEAEMKIGLFETFILQLGKVRG